MLRFKGILTVCVIICFLSFSGASMAEEAKAVPVDNFQQQINDLNNQIKTQNKNSEKLKKTVTDQQDQIKSLKKNLNRVYKQALEDTGQIEVQQQTAGDLKQTVSSQQEEIDKLKSNLAFVYKQTIKDTGMIEKYKLGNEVYLRSSYYDLQRDDVLLSNGMTDDEYENSFVNYFDLKFSAQPADELQFNATLTMYKLWGTWNSPESIRSSDFNYSSNPSDSGVKVKRAYVDYRPQWLGQHVNMTFGRLPTSDGYLTQYRYNRPSQTSYPDLGFNAESDGVAFTFYFDNPLAKSFNLIYARSEDDTDMYPFKDDPQGLEDIDFYAAQLNSNLSFLDNSVFTIQWLRVDNIRMTGDDVLRDSIDDYNMYYGGVLGYPMVTDLVFPQELGYVDKFTMQLNNDRLFDSPIDFFASVAWSKSHPNGDQVTANNMPPTIQSAIESLYLLSSDNQDSHSGWGFYTGLRYNFESQRWLNPKIGLEYFQGSEYWVGLNVAASDPYQKLNTRGSVWEIYWVQPCVENMLQFRTGYQLIDREHTESLFAGLYGAPDDTNEKDKLFYFSLDFMF
jgi:cell division protein FtsB